MTWLGQCQNFEKNLIVRVGPNVPAVMNAKLLMGVIVVKKICYIAKQRILMNDIMEKKD